MPQFESGSTKKLSISGIVAPPQTRVTTADDINNLLGTVAKTADDFVKIVDNEELTRVSKEYNNINAKHQQMLQKAGEDISKQKEAYDYFYSNSIALAKNNSLTEDKKEAFRSKVLGVHQDKQHKYGVIVNEYNISRYKDSLAERQVALGSLSDEQYNEELEVGKLYGLTANQVAEQLITNETNRMIVGLTSGDASFEQMSSAIEDLEKRGVNDKYLANKEYYIKSLSTIHKMMEQLRSVEVAELGVYLQSSYDASGNIIKYEDKMSKIEDLYKRGILKENEYLISKTQTTNVFKEENRRQHREADSRIIYDYELFTSKEQVDSYLKKSKNSAYNDIEREAIVEGWENNNRNYKMTIMSQDISLITSMSETPIEGKIKTLEYLAENAPTETTRNQALIAKQKLETEKKELEIKDKLKASTSTSMSVANRQANLDWLSENKAISPTRVKTVQASIDKAKEAEAEAWVKARGKKLDEWVKENTDKLEDVVTNKEVPFSIKEKMINSSKVWTKEKKELELSKLRAVEQRKQAKADKEYRKVEKAFFTNRVKTIEGLIKNGDYSATIEEYSNAVALAYYDGGLPASTVAKLQTYEAVKTLRQANRELRVLPQTKGLIAVSDYKDPYIDNQLASIYNISDPQQMDALLYKASIWSSNNYSIPKAVQEDINVLETLRTTDPQGYVERFKNYKIDSRAKEVDITSAVNYMRDMWFNTLPENHPAVADIRELATIASKSGMDKKEIQSFVEKHINSSYITDEEWFIGTPVYVPKTTFITSVDTYKSTMKGLSKYFNKDISFMYPQSSTDKENGMWIMYFDDGSTTPVPNDLVRDGAGFNKVRR